jgi:hypothetical protein
MLFWSPARRVQVPDTADPGPRAALLPVHLLHRSILHLQVARALLCSDSVSQPPTCFPCSFNGAGLELVAEFRAL